MYVLPLIKRELNVAIRRPSTLWLRLGAGGGAMGGALWAMMVWGASASFSGAFLFYAMCALAVVAVVFAGVARAMDSICSERKDGTLPLLFLTHLDVWDVLFGKVAAAGAVPFITLFSIFPSLAICQLIGGLAVGTLWSCFLALMIALLFTLCATLLASTMARERRKVVLGATFLLLIVNPLYLLLAAMNLGTALYLLIVVGYLLASGLCLLTAGLVLERTWRVSSKTQEPSISAPCVAATDRAPLDRSPVAWMMLRRWPTRTRVRRVGILCAVTVAVYLGWQIARGPTPVLMLGALFAWHVAILFGILARTAYAFFNERQDGSFELFVSTPLINEDIFLGFAQFLHTRHRPLLIALTVYDAVLTAVLASGRLPRLAPFPMAMALVIWIVFAAVRWLGVYRALMMNSPLLSVFATFTRLALFPMILSVLFLFAPRTDYFKVCVFWVGSTAFLAAFFGSDARRVLIEQGRTLLLRPASEKPPHIESTWSFINWDALENADRKLSSDTPAIA